MPDRTGSGHAQGWALAVTLALALVAPAPVLAQAPGTSAQEAIAALNAQRAAHGIPADLVENPDYSLGCAMHMGDEALHGRSRVQPHAEDPGLPGYIVGLPMGSVTGPHILVMPFGQVPSLGLDEYHGPTRIVAASLTGPAGLVEVRTVDELTVGPRGEMGGYLEGGMLIPAAPLAPATAYRPRAARCSTGGSTLWTSRGPSGRPGTRRPPRRCRWAATARPARWSRPASRMCAA